MDSLRSAITQQDLAHVRDVVAMKSPARRQGPVLHSPPKPRVPLVHSPPKGRARPLPPPGPPGTNGDTPRANGANSHERPRFETFTMTGDMILNLSRTPQYPSPVPRAQKTLDSLRGEERGGGVPGGGEGRVSVTGGGSAPTSPRETGGGGGEARLVTRDDGAPPPPAVSGFRGSRSEDRLQAGPPDAGLEDAGGSFNTLLDTSEPAERDGRVVWTVNAPSDSVPRATLGEFAHLNGRGDSETGGRVVPHNGGSGGIESGGSPTSPPDGAPAGWGSSGGGTPTSPDSEEGSDIESLHSFHFSPKAVDLPSAVRLAKRLYHLDGFKKSDVSRHLGKNNEFNRTVADEYLKHFDFTGDSLDVALGKFLDKFALTGETQERERVLVHFSKRYLENNPRSFNSPDACHTLTCALMLLNTDLHVQHVPRKMTCAEFVDNLSELNDGEDFPRDTLKSLYQAIKAQPLHYAADDEYEEMQSAATEVPSAGAGAGGSNPFLEIPDASKATEYKRGYVMRKCCVEPNGKRTALGKRSWRMFYCTLRDLVLYMHKDENNSRKPGAYDDLHNAIRVHHALATKADDYFKKQHVFKLQTADRAEYLLQTSDAKELQAWIDTLNFVSASLSSPPLAGAVGSQRRFQRPLLPAGITKLNLHDQLLEHEKKVTQLEAELATMEQSPPPKGARTQLVQAYREKFAFLQAEATRYRTYGQLLRSKMAQYPQLEPALLQTPIGELDEE
ncbi:PH and SEC7 domain-containing protein-like, partial [Pollicipes pollicipes]|uniref:PH and SEC7 domain-containing protein-like n=1 Tax=Pollicipes pollicipes TaxID=41117 RepID=UPI001884D07F